MRIVRRAHVGRWLAPAAVAVAVVLTFAIVAGPIRAAGANPFAALQYYVMTPLTTPTGIATVLLAATPLIFTGLSVAIAFRVGFYNIGAEGQFLAGAMAAAIPGLYLSDLPAWLALPLALGAGFVGGMAWIVVPAWLKRHAGIDEVVTTLLLNPVAVLLMQGLLNGPWRNSATGFPDSDRFGDGYTLSEIVPGFRVHWGLALGLVLVVATGIIMAFTPLGLRLRAAGSSPDTARFLGIPVPRLQWRSALVAGGIAGLGGASQVLGVQHHITASIANGYGYTGVIVATLGALSAVGVLLVALLLGLISIGSQLASIALSLPTQMGEIVSALLLLTVVSMMVASRYTIRRSTPRRRPADEAGDPPDEPGLPSAPSPQEVRA